MFAFSQVEPNTAGQVDKLDVPLSKYLDAAFSQGYHDTMFDSIRRMEEYRLENGEDGGELLDPDEANMLYSAPNLRFDKPIRENQAKLLQSRMQEQNYRSAVMEGTSFLSGRGALGFATMLVANMANPLDFAVNLMPFVGEAKIAANVRHLRWLRGPLNRGLITVEQLAEARLPLVSRFPKFTQSVIDATVGQMVAEVPTAMAYSRDKLDYTIENFLINTAMGAAFGAGFHVTIAGAKRAWSHFKPAVKEKMAEKAASDFLNDRDIDVTPIAKLTDEAIFERVWNEGNAKLRAMVTNNPEYKAFANELFQRGQDPINTETLLNNLLAYSDYKIYVEDFRFNNPDGKPLSEKAFHALRKKNLAKLPTSIQEAIQEAWVSGKGVVGGNFFDTTKPRGIKVTEAGVDEFAAITETRETRQELARTKAEFFARPEVRQLLDEKRRELVDKVAAKWAKSFDPQKRFDEVKREELAKLQKDGTMLPPETIAQHTHEHPAVDEGVISKVAKEADDLQKELEIEVSEKVEEPDAIDQALSKVIKALDSDPAKLHIDPLLIETVGKPVLKVMFQVIQKIYRTTRDLKPAVEEAMKYYRAAKAQAELESLREQQATVPDDVKPDYDEAIKIAEKKVKETAIPEPKDETPAEKKSKGMTRRSFIGAISKALAAMQIPVNPAKLIAEAAAPVKAAEKMRKFFVELPGYDMGPGMFTKKAGKTVLQLSKNAVEDDSFAEAVQLYSDPTWKMNDIFKYAYGNMRFENRMGDKNPLDEDILKSVLGVKSTHEAVLVRRAFRKYAESKVSDPSDIHAVEQVMEGIETSLIVHSSDYGRNYFPQLREISIPESLISNFDPTRISDALGRVNEALHEIISKRWKHWDEYMKVLDEYHASDFEIDLENRDRRITRKYQELHGEFEDFRAELMQSDPTIKALVDEAKNLQKAYIEEKATKLIVEESFAAADAYGSDGFYQRDLKPWDKSFEQTKIRGDHPAFEKLQDSITVSDELIDGTKFVKDLLKPSEIASIIDASTLPPGLKERIKKNIESYMQRPNEQINIPDMLHRSILEELQKAKDAEFVARLEDAKPEAVDIALTCILKQL